MVTTVLHTSDSHLGKHQYGLEERTEDFANALWEVIGYAVRKEVDALIHTGDLFDTHDPSQRVVEDAIEIFNHLNQPNETPPIEIPAYLVHGDHDHKGRDGTATPGVDTVCKETHVERLGQNPVVFNDEVAVYGIHNEEIRISGPDVAKQLNPSPSDDLHTLLCTHEMSRKYNNIGKPHIDYRRLRRKAPFNPTVIAAGDVHKRKRWTIRDPRNDELTLCQYAGAPIRYHRRHGDYNPSAFLCGFHEEKLIRDPLLIEDTPRPHLQTSVELSPDDDLDAIAEHVFEQIDPPLEGALLWIQLEGEPVVDTEEVSEYFEARGALQAKVWGDLDYLLNSI